MVARLRDGYRTISIEGTRKGYRTYRVRFIVYINKGDDPIIVQVCPGLPQAGDEFPSDPWCFCTLEYKVTMVEEKQETCIYYVDKTFTNDPSERRCMIVPIDDPLLQPPDVDIEGIRFTEEATTDRFGRPLLMSSHERIRGPQVEFSRTSGQIKIQQNLASYTQAVILPLMMADTVNAFPLWGLPPRSIKLNSPSIRRRYYGHCSLYWARTLTFDITMNGHRHDRFVMDEGGRVLKGHWDNQARWAFDDINGEPPDPSNPKHFVQAIDLEGNPTRLPLNGNGVPAGVVAYRGQPRNIITYICVNAHTSDNSGHTVFSNDWVEFGLGNAPWEEDYTYNSGDVVERIVTDARGVVVDTLIYVNLLDINLDDPLDNTGTWLHLPKSITGRGEWVSGRSYVIGDVVRTPKALPEESGMHPIEYYNESDFLLLGIPTRFDI